MDALVITAILCFLSSTSHAYLDFQTQPFGGSRVTVSDVSKINSIGNSSFTFSLWFKGEYSATESGAHSLLSTRTGPFTGFFIAFLGPFAGYTPFRPFIQLSDNFFAYNASQLYTDNDWHHLVIERNIDVLCTLQYHVDGQNIFTFGPTNSTHCSSSIYLNSSSLRIGDDYSVEGWQGGIAELSIWNRSLNSTEINTTYTNYDGTLENLSLDGLLHYYPLNETSSTCAIDKIVYDVWNGHNGIISGNGTDVLCISEAIGPTHAPTSDPTWDPTIDPTIDPTRDPTIDPTRDPTKDPTVDPTRDPTTNPSMFPSVSPTAATNSPTSDTASPTVATSSPTLATGSPTTNTNNPTGNPSAEPTVSPSRDPSESPTPGPTASPSTDPTNDPTKDPTIDPTLDPTADPTKDPTKDPTTDPTMDPTIDPTTDPTIDPTTEPTQEPTKDPTSDPTKDPTTEPTPEPTMEPSNDPTNEPTINPTLGPTTDYSVKDWMNASECVLPRAVYGSAIGVDITNNDTYILGGNANKKQFLKFNGTLIDYGAPYFPVNIDADMGQFFVQIENILWIYARGPNRFDTFDIDALTYSSNQQSVPSGHTDPFGRSCIDTITLDHQYLLMAGGYSFGFVYEATAFILNVSSGEWIANVPSLNSARGNSACNVVGDTFYMMGGTDINIEILDVSNMDIISTLSWITLNITLPRNRFRSVVYEDDILMLGGSGYESDVYALYTIKNTIRYAGEMLYGVRRGAPVVVYPLIYYWGGQGGTNRCQYFSVAPTRSPTMDPTSDPTTEPTQEPTTEPTQDPTQEPTTEPTSDPSIDPSIDPTSDPSFDPTKDPTTEPTIDPTYDPTSNPTQDPTIDPTADPTIDPTTEPTLNPTNEPTMIPSENPTEEPTQEPTNNPSAYPTKSPTSDPSTTPTLLPTSNPTFTFNPTHMPSVEPTDNPTVEPTIEPSNNPTSDPSNEPTRQPSTNPSAYPTEEPTIEPTNNPSTQPTFYPTAYPSTYPTNEPTVEPTSEPSVSPTINPTIEPSFYPTNDPTLDPTRYPSLNPTSNPSLTPSKFPSVSPSVFPTLEPTTSYPTTSTKRARRFEIKLLGEFNAVRNYTNNNDTNLRIWATGVIEICLKVHIYPILSNIIINIFKVYEGSIVIDFEIQSNNEQILSAGLSNLNETILIDRNITVDGGFTFTIEPKLYTLHPTKEPTSDPSLAPSSPPTAGPTNDPTLEPTMEPTHYPTIEPTLNPTLNPTAAPTNGEVYCMGDHDNEIEQQSNGLWEYYLYINETGIVRFDTCGGILGGDDVDFKDEDAQIFDIELYQDAYNISSHTEDNNIGCKECGTICLPQSQFVTTLTLGTYLMKIDGPHQFKIKCQVTDPPTMSLSPTDNPTPSPSNDPTTPYPTISDPTQFNVSFDGPPSSLFTFMSDPYGRFEASIIMTVLDEDSIFGRIDLYSDFFMWQYNLNHGSKWVDIDHINDNDISIYISRGVVVDGQTQYTIKLTIQSIRTSKAGYCITNKENRIFTPGNDYQLRLQFVAISNQYRLSLTSESLSITTNTLPSGGECVIQDLDNLVPLDQYNLFCGLWNNDNQTNLEFNALINGVTMNRNGFVDDARQLISTAPSGSVEITVLIKDRRYTNAITCYDIEAEFKSIIQVINDELDQNDTNIADVVDDIIIQIETLTNETSYIDEPDVAVSVVTVIDEIYQYSQNGTNLTQQVAQMLVDDVIQNIVERSKLSGALDIIIQVQNGSQNVSWLVLSQDIVTELSTISAITSNEDIIDVETTTTTLVEEYLPEILEAIDVFISISITQNANYSNAANEEQQAILQDQLYTIASQSQDLIENLEATLEQQLSVIEQTANNSVVDSLNELAQSLVEYATLAASKALSQSDPGESFNYESIDMDEDGTITNKKIIACTKFESNIDFNDPDINEQDIELPSCGTFEQGIQLPLTFVRQQAGTFDCAFMSSTRNNFVPKENINADRAQNSEVISINIYGEQASTRRLQQVIEHESDRCSPYLITMKLSDANNAYNLDMRLDQEFNFPSCDFWNVNESFWDTHGCFVYNITNDTIICGCTHLTTFSLSKDDILLEANTLTEIDWRRLTLRNLWKHPTVWITFAILSLIFVIMGFINPLSSKLNSKSIIAFEDIIYKSVQEKKLWADIVGKEIKYITTHMPNQHRLGEGIKQVASGSDAKKSICLLQFKLFRAYLRNDHTLLSVFQRSAGTNFSVKQRLGCFFMYLCTVMVTTGTFYGLEQSNIVKDIIASFVISLCSTLPTLIVRKIFEKSKPREVASEKHDLEDIIRRKSTVLDGDDGEVNGDKDEMEGGEEVTTAIVPKLSLVGSKDFGVNSIMNDAGNNITMAIFLEELDKLFDDEDRETKIMAVSDIRQYLFNSMFPLPSYFKKVAWILLIIWSAAAFVTALVYGLQFDVEYSMRDNPANKNYEIYQREPCWNTSLALRTESELSLDYFNEKNAEKQAENAASFGESDSRSWLLSIGQSLMTSLLLWQPLTVYIITWLKIWMFTWHLKMKIGPGNIILLCKRCCCGYNKYGDYEYNNKKDGAVPAFVGDKPKLEAKQSTQITEVVAHKNRPVDIISFIGNEDWIIDDTIKAKSMKDLLALVNNEEEKEEKDDGVLKLILNEKLSPEVELQELGNDEQRESVPLPNQTKTTHQMMLASIVNGANAMRSLDNDGDVIANVVDGDGNSDDDEYQDLDI